MDTLKGVHLFYGTAKLLLPKRAFLCYDKKKAGGIPYDDTP